MLEAEVMNIDPDNELQNKVWTHARTHTHTHRLMVNGSITFQELKKCSEDDTLI